MAASQPDKVKQFDGTPSDEGKLDFDDDTLRGM